MHLCGGGGDAAVGEREAVHLRGLGECISAGGEGACQALGPDALGPYRPG